MMVTGEHHHYHQYCMIEIDSTSAWLKYWSLTLLINRVAFSRGHG